MFFHFRKIRILSRVTEKYSTFPLNVVLFYIYHDALKCHVVLYITTTLNAMLIYIHHESFKCHVVLYAL